MSDAQSFEYVDLKEIDPNFQTVPDGFYGLKVIKAFLKRGVAGPQAKNPGKEWQQVKMQLAITDDGEQRGKRVFEQFFFGNRELQNLRRLMDVTGIVQEEGETFEEWLTKISNEGPSFRTRVIRVPRLDRVTKQPLVDQITGQPVYDNEVVWKEVQPAG